MGLFEGIAHEDVVFRPAVEQSVESPRHKDVLQVEMTNVHGLREKGHVAHVLNGRNAFRLQFLQDFNQDVADWRLCLK